MKSMRSRVLFVVGLVACASSTAPIDPPPGATACPSPPCDPGRPGTDPDTDPDPPPGGLPDGGSTPPAPTYKHYDINHVLSTGASDSVGNGSPTITTQAALGNLSFDEGVMIGKGRPGQPDGACDGEGCLSSARPRGFRPLVEGDSFLGYPVETMSSGLAAQASTFASAWFSRVGLPARGHDLLVSVHGRSGNEYWCLRKSGCYKNPPYNIPFDEAIEAARIAKELATAQGKSYVVRAVTAIHGQGDSDDNETMLRTLVRRTDGSGEFIGNYTNALIEWQRDFETEIRKATAQTEAVPLFISQFGSFTAYERSVIPPRQLAAHVAAPGKVVVVTPNYPFEHARDCNHYSSHGMRRLGAYFAKAYQRVVVEGGVWDPVRPLEVTRSGATITVRYVVPVPPLAFDTTRVTDPGNLGFRYTDSTSSAQIAKVELAGADAVRITLTAAPTGANKLLSYAQNAIAGRACPGPTEGTRGNLRDSDPAVGYYRDGDNRPYELHNWAVQADMPVP